MAERSLNKAKQEQWKELDHLLWRARGLTVRNMEAKELLRLGKLYRLASAELMRTRHLSPQTALNRLVGLGYAVLYAQPPLQRLRFWRSLWQLFWFDFPFAIRTHLPFVLLTLMVITIMSLLTAFIILYRPDLAPGWVNESLLIMLQEVAQRHKEGYDWLPLMGRPFAFLIILLNNLRVALTGFSLGICMMFPAIYILSFNGLLIGCVLAVSWNFGTFNEVLGFVTPHGIVEIPAFCITSAAGMAMGYRFLCPGDFHRLTALITAGRKAMPMLIGGLLMLLYAACIEAFFSPQIQISPVGKIACGCAEGVFLLLYFIVRGNAIPHKV